MSTPRPTDDRVGRLRYGIAALIAGALIAMLLFRAAPHPERKITIVAASDLQFAMDEIVASFRKGHPGDQIDLIYGSSGKFHTQIQQGAPYDIFFSADVAFARSLKAADHATTEPRLYAVGRIVLWSATRDATRLDIASLSDPSIRRIAIANPRHAPYGKRAEEALRAAGIWERVQDKLIFAENVAQAAQYAQSGAADIGIIALALAVNEELARKGGYWLVPQERHAPLEQAYVVTRHGAGNPLAAAFAAHMETPGVRAVMTRYGFARPGEVPGS